jgi:hypothetical protein
LRNAFDLACAGDVSNAIIAFDGAISSEYDEKTKGFLLSIEAEYTNLIDRSRSQQILQSARRLNQSLVAPIAGIQYEKVINKKVQARAIKEYLDSVFPTSNDCIICVNAVLNDLSFNPDIDANIFEQALQDVGQLLGFESSRPEKEGTGGPDNMWAVGNNRYFVIECKSGAETNTISKRYCDQLGGSIRWFNSEYGGEYEAFPIMIHPVHVINKDASPPIGMRVITPMQLDKFKRNASDFFTALVQADNWNNVDRISSLLVSYQLRYHDIVQSCSVDFVR